MFIGTLGARLFRDLLTFKGATATSQGRGTIRAGKALLEKVGFLMLPHHSPCSFLSSFVFLLLFFSFLFHLLFSLSLH